MASPRIALPPLTPPVGRPLACRQALPRVRGSRPWDPVHGHRMRRAGAHAPYLWPPRRMPHGPVRRFWPRGPLWAARPDDPVARVRLRPGGRPARGARKSQTAGRGGRRCVRRLARQGRSARARKGRRVPVPGRRPQRVTRRGLRLPLSGRTPPARGRRARRSPCCTRGRSTALRRVRPCRSRPPGRRTRRRSPPARPS